MNRKSDNSVNVSMDFFDEQENLCFFCMNGSKDNRCISDDLFKDYDVVFFNLVKRSLGRV